MDFNKIDMKKGVALSLLVLAIALVIVVEANTAAAGIDMTKVDPVWQGSAYAFKAFFKNGYTVLFVTWTLNAVGLVIVYAKLKASDVPTLSYNVWKFYGTMALAIGIGITALATLPEPYGQVTLVLSAIAKILETSFSKVVPDKPVTPSGT